MTESSNFEESGRDRDRTDDLYRVKVALIPTELRARRRYTDSTSHVKTLSTALTAAERGELARDGIEALQDFLITSFRWIRVFGDECDRSSGFQDCAVDRRQ
jgi:hypothetical protein